MAHLYVGTSGWAYPSWKPAFYPEKLAQKKFLNFYASKLNAVEVNFSFRQLLKETTIANWLAQTPEHFRFTIKAHQVLTHIKRLKDADDSVEYLLKVAAVLKEKLGPLLFQLPPFLKKDAPRLRAFLERLPKSPRAAFEFRHQSWFDQEILDLLRGHGAVLCIAEAETDLETPFASTADWGYLRLRRPDYGEPELKAWVERVRQQDWREVFIFFKHEEAGKGPQMARRFLQLWSDGG